MIASHWAARRAHLGRRGDSLLRPLGGRYGNWGLIPVSDIALELPDPRYSRAIRGELLWLWLPTGLLVGLVMAYRRLKRNATEGKEIIGPTIESGECSNWTALLVRSHCFTLPTNVVTLMGNSVALNR